MHEIRRRQLATTVIAYLAFCWLIVQAAAIIGPAFAAPTWTVRLIVIVSALCFPLVITLAWFFNITREGVQRISQLDVAPSNNRDLCPQLPPSASAIASVTVLPFDDLNTEPDPANLADGLATEIHSTLSQMHQVRVASRRSAFRYRNSTEPVTKIARELGVRYVLSGSLLRAGDRVRVIAELDDATTGTQIWSQKFERQTDDLLTIQAEIAAAIVGAFGIERERSEIALAQQQPTKNLDAWSLLQKARNYINNYSPASLAEAESLLKRSIKLDKNYAAAHAALSSVLIEQVLTGCSKNKTKHRETALAEIALAQQLTPRDPFVLKMAGLVLAACGRHDQAVDALRRCISIAPFDFGAWGYFGWPLTARADEHDLQELIEIVDRLLQVAPEHPGRPYWLYHKSVAIALQGNLSAATELLAATVPQHQPAPWAWMHLANVYGLLERPEDARSAAAQARQINPHLTAEHYAECICTMTRGDVTRRRLQGLVAAGLLSDAAGSGL